ncbi:unnamed protein product [Lactuca virosa]|uniref:WPP domain-containing protein n=1 Tax=Lactuca virosa TaxID=75947 RepID=A0AAU9P2E8_9ASTR|nr:unnamed protein product [Lactuca virosa]
MDVNESISPEELGNVGESEIKLKSNGVCHVEDVNDSSNGSSSPSVNKRGLRKWRRMPRELVKNPGSKIDSRNNGDLGDSLVRDSMVNVNGNSKLHHGDSGLGDHSVLATRADSENSEDQSIRSSYAPRTRPKISNSNGGNSAISVHSGNQKSNHQTGSSKKLRGFNIEKENSDSNMDNFLFVQGTTNSVATKSKQSGNSTKHDDDELVNNEIESEGVTQEDAEAKDSWEVKEEKIEKHEVGFDQDALVESITSFDSSVEELEIEVQKWKDIGKDESEPLTFDDSIRNILELKDATISELESAITSADTKTELDELLKENIQAEVEIVAITTTTKSLMHEMKHNLQDDVKKLENKKVLKKQETEEDVKRLKNRVCRLSSCLLIQLILLFVTFYIEISSQKVELVPT